MAIRLSEAIRAQIRAHGVLDFPYECCGALLGTVEKETRVLHHPGDESCEREVTSIDVKVVLAVMPAENVHEDGHERRFLIDPKTTLLLAKQERAGGLIVLGYYHSHPNHPARPSLYDLEAAFPRISYIILSVIDSSPAELTCWTLNSEETEFEEELMLS